MYLKKFIIIFSLIIIGCDNNKLTKLIVDNDNNISNQENFLPLEVGNSWKYQIVYSDFDISKESFQYPRNFTVEVIAKVNINDIDYFAVKNLFFPGPVIPEISYIRSEENYVYMLIDNVEYLLYSFGNSEKQSWHLPMQVNDALKMEYYVNSNIIDSTKSTFLWHMGPNPDRAEAKWTDVFVKGKGRVKIESISQAYGKIIWEIKNN